MDKSVVANTFSGVVQSHRVLTATTDEEGTSGFPGAIVQTAQSVSVLFSFKLMAGLSFMLIVSASEGLAQES